MMKLDACKMWPSLSRSSRLFWRSLASSLGAKAVSTRFLTSLVVHSVVGRSDNLCGEEVEEEPFTPSCLEDKVIGVS